MPITKSQMKSTVTGILFLFYFHSWAQTDKADYTRYLKLIDCWLDAQKDFDRLPGLSVAIVHNQHIRLN